MSVEVSRPTASRVVSVGRVGAGKVVEWVASGLLVMIVVVGAVGFFGNEKVGLDVVPTFLFEGRVLQGVAVTVALTLISQALAYALGGLLVLAQTSHNPVFVGFAHGYIGLFRSIPLLLQILIWFNIAIFLPRIGLEIPFTDIGVSWDTNEIITPFTAAILALTFNEAAYIAEVFRSGLSAIPPAQYEAAESLGMSRGATYRRIIIPQALIIIVPPLGNQFIGLLLATSLVSQIGGGDLMTAVQRIYGQNFQILPLLIVATIWYLFFTIVITVFQTWLTNRLAHEKVQLYPFEGPGRVLLGLLRRIESRPGQSSEVNQASLGQSSPAAPDPSRPEPAAELVLEGNR